MLQQAYGQDCFSCTQCHEWYQRQRFKSGRTSIEIDPQIWKAFQVQVEKVLAMIRQNRRLTVREVAE